MKKITFFSLAKKNIIRKPERTLGLMVATAMLAFVIFAGLVLTLNLEKGMDKISQRFGADIMVVPSGYDGDMESIMLGGNPKYFYFDKSIEDKVKKISGVEKVSSQLYIISSSQSCCSSQVQFIGYDPETDFVVMPWINTVYSTAVGKDEVIAGNKITVNSKKTLKFYGKYFKVVAKLDETGGGSDFSIYAPMDTLKNMYEAARAKGFKFKDFDIDRSISSIMVKVAPGESKKEAAFLIEKNIKGVKAVCSEDIVNNLSNQLGGMVVYIRLLQVFVLIFSIISLSMLFNVTIRERKMEFATLRAIGASSNFTKAVVLSEALVICLIGGISGIALAALVIFPFKNAIGEQINLPYVSISPLEIVLAVLGVLFITIIVGLVSAYKAANSAGNSEIYLTMREEP